MCSKGYRRLQPGHYRFGCADMIEVPMGMENTGNMAACVPDTFEYAIWLCTWIDEERLARPSADEQITVCRQQADWNTVDVWSNVLRVTWR